MRIGLIGRTSILLDIAKAIHAKGYKIPFILTAPNTLSYFQGGEKEICDFSKEINAEYYNTTKINDPEIVEKIIAHECDIALTFSWINILTKPICEAFKIGVLNIHGGDLPRYRGNACQAWAILNGEEEIGLSVHLMEPNKLDSGDIIIKEYFSLTPDTYVGEFFDWFRQNTIPLYMRAIAILENGERVFQRQSANPEHILRCYPRKPEDSRIDWSLNVGDIYKLIRASSHPYPGAFCYFENRKLIIWKATITPHEGKFLAIPGQVLYSQNQNAVIACGDGVIELQDVCLEGCATHEEAQKQILKSLRNRLTSYLVI